MAQKKEELDPLALIYLDLWRRWPVAGSLN